MAHGYMSVEDLANALGVKRSRIRSWTMSGLGTQELNGWYRVTPKELADFLAFNPRRAFDLDAGRLRELLGEEGHDRVLAAMAKARPPAHPCPKPSRPVRNVTTGVVYPGLAEAGRQSYISYQAIRRAALEGTISAGCRWEFVETETE